MTIHNMELLPKSAQTVTYALKALQHPFRLIQLTDISKKLWTPEVLRVAVLNGRAPLTVLKEEDRTEALCLEACRWDPSQISNVPAAVKSHDFLVKFVSQCPKASGAALYHERIQFMAKAVDYNRSVEVAELSLAAIVPMAYGHDCIANLREPLTLEGDALTDYIADHYGSADLIPKSILREALTLLLDKRRAENDDHGDVNMGMSKLRDALLDIGGDDVCFPDIEEDLQKILARGRYWPGASKMMLGRPCQCHANAAELWSKNHKAEDIRICTGYALSSDGLWRQHSWLTHYYQTKTQHRKRLIETTKKRIAYFGFEMTEDEAAQFEYSNY